MEKLSKIHIKGILFISTNFLYLILINKISNATPVLKFSKPSTLSLLSEIVKNPSNSFIERLSNGKLKATFLVSGRRGVSKNVYGVRGGSTVSVKKTPDSNYKTLHGTLYQKKHTAEGVAFKVLTTSSNGLHKEIKISEENGNIIINSKKGERTSNYVVKSTTLDFGNGASTSSQASSPYDPRIISNRLSNYDEKEGKFIIEQTNIYDPLSLRLISSTIKNNLTGETTSSTKNENQTKATTSSEFFSKPSMTRILSETIKNPETAPITKTPDGKIKATFLHFGKSSSSINNVIIRNSSIVAVRKDYDKHFEEIKRTKSKINLESEGVEFKVYTRSKHGLDKEINISQENGNIVVNSVKGIGTLSHTIKKTILNFGNDSSSPQIKQTKLYLPNNETKEFNMEKTSTYDATTHKLLEQVTRNNLTKEIEYIHGNQDNTKTKIIEQANGNKNKFIITEDDEIIYSETKDTFGNTLIMRKLNEEFLSSKKINTNGNLIEESVSSPYQYESRTYDENGFMTSSSRSNTLSGGDSIGTTLYSNGESITQEHRGDGSLKTTITRTSTGELFKQDFDENSKPLNNPYRID